MRRECGKKYGSVICRKQIEAGDEDADLLASDEEGEEEEEEGMEEEPASASENGMHRESN